MIWGRQVAKRAEARRFDGRSFRRSRVIGTPQREHIPGWVARSRLGFRKYGVQHRPAPGEPGKIVEEPKGIPVVDGSVWQRSPSIPPRRMHTPSPIRARSPDHLPGRKPLHEIQSCADVRSEKLRWHRQLVGRFSDWDVTHGTADVTTTINGRRGESGHSREGRVCRAGSGRTTFSSRTGTTRENGDAVAFHRAACPCAWRQ